MKKVFVPQQFELNTVQSNFDLLLEAHRKYYFPTSEDLNERAEKALSLLQK